MLLLINLITEGRSKMRFKYMKGSPEAVQVEAFFPKPASLPVNFIRLEHIVPP